jgi:homoserine dehydrogenase
MSKKSQVNIGLLGLGVVGSAVAQVLLDPSGLLSERTGSPIFLRRVLVRDLTKHRSLEISSELLTADPEAIVADPEIDVVIEVMGGEHPASEHIEAALRAGKHVVTANKELMAKRGPELLNLAAESGVQLLFEASVGGGIPIVGPLRKDLQANEIEVVYGIINGTTNYILTRMGQEGADFQDALVEAQAKGYAEPDPTADVEGIDAAFKLAILASLAFHTWVRATDVYREGISRLKARDFRYAEELGYAIKLLAIAKKGIEGVEARVHPTLIPKDVLLAKVDGVFNAVEVTGDLTGPVQFYGRGAGPQPTSSAVLANVLEIARGLASGNSFPAPPVVDRGFPVRPMSDLVTRYYLRITATDSAGVLAKISHVLGDENISVASVIQKETDPVEGTAELVLTTHPSSEKAMQKALEELERLDVVWEIGNLVRIEQMGD